MVVAATDEGVGDEVGAGCKRGRPVSKIKGSVSLEFPLLVPGVGRGEYVKPLAAIDEMSDEA